MEAPKSRVDQIIDPITEVLEAEEIVMTADEVAWIALQGLKESVHLGYMRDHNARAMYARHFPGHQYGPDDPEAA